MQPFQVRVTPKLCETIRAGTQELMPKRPEFARVAMLIRRGLELAGVLESDADKRQRQADDQRKGWATSDFTVKNCTPMSEQKPTVQPGEVYALIGWFQGGNQ